MIRVALIGCGDIASNGHLPAIRNHPRFALAAVCDTDRERACRLSRREGGVPVHEDWHALLDREAEIDAVVLAVPPEVSPDIAIASLHRGLPVLDEKPLAATVRDGHRVARAVAESGGVYQIGFVLRYGDWVGEVARRARAIGTPARVRVTIHDERLDRNDLEHFSRMQGFLGNSSAITHEGSHVIDYTGLWLPSPWTRVRASARRTAPDFAGPNLWSASVELADRSVLEIEIGWLLDQLAPFAVTIDGPNGRLELNPANGAGHWRIGGASGLRALPPMVPEWGRQYDAFARAIDRGHAEAATIDDGLRALEVTISSEVSARTGVAVNRDEIAVSPKIA